MTTPKSLRNFRIVLWALVAVVAIGATGLFLFRPPARPLGVTGQAFELASTQGGTFTQDSLKGTPSLIFFGYTFCPDVCPTTLAETTAWRAQLGLTPTDGQRVSAVAGGKTPSLASKGVEVATLLGRPGL